MSTGYAAAAAQKNKTLTSKNRKNPRIPNSMIYDHSASAFYLELKNGIYEGELINYKREGKGILFGDEGIMYIGSWKNDQLNGLAIIIYPNGGYLYGNFEKNRLEGVGVFRNYDESSVVAYWKQSNIHGSCFHFNTEKKIWTHSEYSNGLVMKYINEERSVSSEKASIPVIIQNYPALKAAMMDCYSLAIFQKMEDAKIGKKQLKLIQLTEELFFFGFIKGSMPNGLGLVFSDTNVLLLGNFRDGILDGMGRINLDNGDIYDGFFRQGTFNGEGLYYNHQSDNFIFGQFSDNLCSQVSQRGSDFPLKLMREFKQYRHERTVYFFSGAFHYSLLKLNPPIFKEEHLKTTAFSETQKQIQKLIADCNPNNIKKANEKEEYYEKYMKSDEKQEKKKNTINQQEISEINVEEDLEIVEKKPVGSKIKQQSAGRPEESKINKVKKNIKETEKDVEYLKDMENFTVKSKNNRIGAENSLTLNSSRNYKLNPGRSKSRDRSLNASISHEENKKSQTFEVDFLEEESKVNNSLNKYQKETSLYNEESLRDVIPNFMSSGRDPMNTNSVLKQRFQSNKGQEMEPLTFSEKNRQGNASSSYKNDSLEYILEKDYALSSNQRKGDLYARENYGNNRPGSHRNNSGFHTKNMSSHNEKNSYHFKENQNDDTNNIFARPEMARSRQQVMSESRGKVFSPSNGENSQLEILTRSKGANKIPSIEQNNTDSLRKSARSGFHDSPSYMSATTSGISAEFGLNKEGLINPNESIRKPIFTFTGSELQTSPEKSSKIIGYPDQGFAVGSPQDFRLEKISKVAKESDNIREFSPQDSRLNRSLNKSGQHQSPSRKKDIFEDFEKNRKNMTTPALRNIGSPLNESLNPLSSPGKNSRKKIFDQMNGKVSAFNI